MSVPPVTNRSESRADDGDEAALRRGLVVGRHDLEDCLQSVLPSYSPNWKVPRGLRVVCHRSLYRAVESVVGCGDAAAARRFALEDYTALLSAEGAPTTVLADFVAWSLGRHLAEMRRRMKAAVEQSRGVVVFEPRVDGRARLVLDSSSEDASWVFHAALNVVHSKIACDVLRGKHWNKIVLEAAALENKIVSAETRLSYEGGGEDVSHSPRRAVEQVFRSAVDGLPFRDMCAGLARLSQRSGTYRRKLDALREKHVLDPRRGVEATFARYEANVRRLDDLLDERRLVNFLLPPEVGTEPSPAAGRAPSNWTPVSESDERPSLLPEEASGSAKLSTRQLVEKIREMAAYPSNPCREVLKGHRRGGMTLVGFMKKHIGPVVDDTPDRDGKPRKSRDYIRRPSLELDDSF